MHDIQELSEILGLPERRIRHRVELLSRNFPEVIRRGPRRKILVTDEGFALLRRLIELERSGIPPSEGIVRVGEETKRGKPKEKARVNSVKFDGRSELIEELKREISRLERIIEDLKRDRDHWRELALSLQQQALPRPRRWWRWWPWSRGKELIHAGQSSKHAI